MSDREQLDLLKSFLAAPEGCATPADVMAWEDFFHNHDPIIRAVFARSRDCRNVLDDLTQDVWCMLVRRLGSLRLDPARGTLTVWVATIARHQAGRHARRLSRHHDTALTLEVADSLVEADGGLAADSNRKQRREMVRAILEKLAASLPALHHRIIFMYWLEEKSLAQIAAKVGQCQECVRAIVRRVSVILRDLLRSGGLGPS